VKAGTVAETARTREAQGEYGYDGSFHAVSAGAQVAGVAGISAVLFAGAGAALARGNRLAAALGAASVVQVLATTASYIYATRRGKFVVLDRILDELGLRGDGIMSAINFSVDLQKKPHPSGDRVVVTFDGKYLAYDWVSAEN
jgi:cyanate lyase-like protein